MQLNPEPTSQPFTNFHSMEVEELGPWGLPLFQLPHGAGRASLPLHLIARYALGAFPPTRTVHPVQIGVRPCTEQLVLSLAYFTIRRGGLSCTKLLTGLYPCHFFAILAPPREENPSLRKPSPLAQSTRTPPSRNCGLHGSSAVP
jgi:hypothetical protein